jgi:hypothetical protein
MEQPQKSNNQIMLEKLLNNKLFRIIIALLFFLFVYRIIYNVLIFFSLNPQVIQMYMAWVAVFILLLSILPQKRYEFSAIKKLN